MPKRIEKTLSNVLGIARDDLSVITTHLFLVAGIVIFSWDVGELILVYLIEIAITCVLFGTVAMFAAQPVDNHEADKWQEEPNPIKIASFLPPLYKRNVRLVGRELLSGGFFFFFFAGIAISLLDRSITSLLSTTVGVTILTIFVSQMARVWRQFLAGQSYRNRSPAEAIKIALRPIARLTVIAMYVVAPITVVLGFTMIVLLDIASPSAIPHGREIVLLAYVVPIGAASVWLRNDRFGVDLQKK